MMNNAAKIINFQLSMFGEFSNISSDTSLIIKLLSALQDKNFLPGTLNSASVDVQTGKFTVNNKLQLYSPNKSWTISFLDNRIDFNYSYHEMDPRIWSIDSLIEYGGSLIDNVFPVLNTDMKGNRLAVNSKMIFDDMTDEQLDKIGKKLVPSPTEDYKKNYIDWRLSLNSQEEILFPQDHKETYNRILEILKYNYFENSAPTQQRLPKKTMMISLDLNTLPQKMESRFTKDSLKYFSNKVRNFIENTVNSITEGYL